LDGCGFADYTSGGHCHSSGGADAKVFCQDRPLKSAGICWPIKLRSLLAIPKAWEKLSAEYLSPTGVAVEILTDRESG
jgi:hypothetical protein